MKTSLLGSTNVECYTERVCPFCGSKFYAETDDRTDNGENYEVYCPRCGEKDLPKYFKAGSKKARKGSVLDPIAVRESGELLRLEGFDGKSEDNTDVFCDTEWLLRLYGERRDEIKGLLTCACCGTRVRVIGCSFICHCCGYSNAISEFKGALERLEGLADCIDNLMDGSCDKDVGNVLKLTYAEVMKEAYRGYMAYVRQAYSLLEPFEPSVYTFSTPTKTVRVFERIGNVNILDEEELSFLENVFSLTVRPKRPSVCAVTKDQTLSFIRILKHICNKISGILIQ